MQSASRDTSRLRLAAHVRACRIDGQVILLDLRRGKYLGIGGPLASLLAQDIDGWPSAPMAAPGPPPAGDLRTLAGPLWSRGLITDGPVARAHDVRIDEASASLDAEEPGLRVAIGARRACRMLRCAATSALWLRCRSLQSIAEAVAARRTRLAGNAGRPVSPDEISHAVAAYRTMRPLFFTARDRCLHDSLTLVGFLAHEGILARWIIGVQTRPFGAHSWVQIGSVVLNDEAGRVRKFKPILVV